MSHPVAPLPDVASTLLSWSVEPAVVVPALAAAALYWRGWRSLSRRLPARFGPRRLVAFAAGLAGLVVALCSPLDALGRHLLQAHMLQHMLLLLVAPPLLWLGAPVAPLLLGMPRVVRAAVARGLAAPALRPLLAGLASPGVGLGAFIATFWIWHVPALYERALASDPWHHLQHLCFLSAALLFWRPVVLAWPARARWPRLAMVPYLIAADIQNTVLAAVLAFSDHVIYPSYDAVSRPGGLSALDDQAIAGAIMWVPGSIPFLLPVLCLVVRALDASGAEREGRPTQALERRTAR